MIQLNVANGQPVSGGSTPSPGQQFQWVNYNTSSTVTIKHCGNWASPDSCTVPAALPGPPVQPGVSETFTVLQTPNTEGCAFSDSGWNTPGLPHVGLSPFPTQKPAAEKEVA